MPKTIKVPNKFLAESIAGVDWAKDFVKNPCIGTLIYYFAQSDGDGVIDWSDCSNWLKRFKKFLKTLDNPEDFLKGYNYKKLKKEVYDDFAFSTGQCNAEIYKWQIKLATPLVEFCDYLKIDIKTDPTPNHWWSDCKPDLMFEYDFKEAVKMCSKKEFKNFCRLFSKEPKDWFPVEERCSCSWWK